jgi:hypothetical protein
MKLGGKMVRNTSVGGDINTIHGSNFHTDNVHVLNDIVTGKGANSFGAAIKRGPDANNGRNV